MQGQPKKFKLVLDKAEKVWYTKARKEPNLTDCTAIASEIAPVGVDLTHLSSRSGDHSLYGTVKTD